MADFCQFLTKFFMEFINIGPVYIRRWVGGAQGWRGWWQNLTKKQEDIISSKAMVDGPVGQILARLLFLKVKTKFHFAESR